MAVRYVIDAKACRITTAIECFSLYGRINHVAEDTRFLRLPSTTPKFPRFSRFPRCRERVPPRCLVEPCADSGAQPDNFGRA